MNVLSLFDGMSCGRIALEKAGIPVEVYISSEVDKYAIQVADKNHPQDAYSRMGDVRGVKAEHLPPIDLLIGGSPCQSFSFAGKRKGMATKCDVDILSLEHYLQLKAEGFEFQGQSYLFWEYMRLLKETGAKYFFLENVVMSKKWEKILTDAIGVAPIMINSALVSAQNRKRLYWTNIPGVEQPMDKGILLQDILETGISTESTGVLYNVNPSGRGMNGNVHGSGGKSPCLTTNKGEGVKIALRPCTPRDFDPDALCHHVANASDIKGNDQIKRVYGGGGKAPTVNTCQGGHREPKVLCGASRGRYLVDGKRQDGKMKTSGLTKQMMEVRDDDKTNCLTTVQKDNYIVFDSKKGARFPAEEATYRKLTPLECERLQTVPDGYTDHVSNSQRYKMLGNGWTVDVIAHIFKGLL